MRERVYVPKRIANAATEKAVTTLALALCHSGACGYADAKERICRLLGWMCERKVDE